MMFIDQELDICRSIDQKSQIAPFIRSLTKWELLLTIAKLNGDPAYGIWNYIDLLQTRTENPMTIYNFIKAKIDDGSFTVSDSSKKSRKTLELSEALMKELMVFLAKRTPKVTPEVTNVTVFESSYSRRNLNLSE